jgi:hypothetical protein
MTSPNTSLHSAFLKFAYSLVLPFPNFRHNLQEVGKFLGEHWEKAPAVFKAKGNSERAALIQGAMSFASFCCALDELEESGECLLFERDVNAMCFKAGKRQSMNRGGTDASLTTSEMDLVVDRSTAEELFAAGATLQVPCSSQLHKCSATSSAFGAATPNDAA